MLILIFENSWWDNLLIAIKYPPWSMLFILIVSIFVSLISTTLNKLLVDQKALNEKQEVIKAHQKKKKVLSEMAEADPKRYAKEYRAWKKVDASVQKMQQKTSLERLKPTCATFIPIILFFTLLRNFYSVNGVFIPVAKPPMNPWDVYYVGQMMHASFQSTIRNIEISEGWINFTGYYFLCSLSMNTFLQKLMGIQRPDQGGMGSMFDQNVTLPEPKF